MTGTARAPYVAAMPRIGPLLKAAVRRLGRAPDVLLSDGTSRDHPRRAGPRHLGAERDLPTVGINPQQSAPEGTRARQPR